MTNHTDTPRAESLQEIERLVLDYGIAAYSDGNFGDNVDRKIAALLSAITRVVQERESWKSRYDEEYKIVDRIWKQLGSPSYEQLAGRSIYDLIAERDARIAVLENALRAACKLYHGRAHFITAQGVLMEMPEKAERIVRYALATEQPHE